MPAVADRDMHRARDVARVPVYDLRPEGAEAAQRAAEAARPRVLLVEDNLVNQRLGCRLLEKLGYEAVTANDGQQALDVLVRERAGGESKLRGSKARKLVLTVAGTLIGYGLYRRLRR